MEQPCYDSNAAKKAANLSVNSDLLAQARALKINLSRVLGERLAELVREARRQEWLEENRPAINDYNDRVAKQGSFGDSVRRF